MTLVVATVLLLADWEGLKAREKIAQGKASLRATPWVNRPQNSQALKGRQNSLTKSREGAKPPGFSLRLRRAGINSTSQQKGSQT